MRKRRRANGEGSIVQRADGTWMFAASLGKDETGKPLRRYIYAPTRAALLRKVADMRARGGGSIRPVAAGTVGEWVERWLRDDVKPNRSPNTYALYETIWRVHTAPLIASIRLERFDVEHVQQLYASLREEGVSSAVIQRVSVVMSRAFEVATRMRVYHKPNPFAIVDKPRHQAKEARVLTIDEARRFLHAVRGNRYEALWIVLLTAGLRLGEALGLEWRDVDLERGTLSVRQALTEVNGSAAVGPLKTKGSRRLVEIGHLAVEALRRRNEHARAERYASSFVFTTMTGGHPRRSNLRQRHFEPICVSVGISGVTIHGLRHSMTSLALAEGIVPKIVAERLGHSTVRLTQDRYGHVLPGVQREAANAIDALLDDREDRDQVTQ